MPGLLSFRARVILLTDGPTRPTPRLPVRGKVPPFPHPEPPLLFSFGRSRSYPRSSAFIRGCVISVSSAIFVTDLTSPAEGGWATPSFAFLRFPACAGMTFLSANVTWSSGERSFAPTAYRLRPIFLCALGDSVVRQKFPVVSSQIAVAVPRSRPRKTWTPAFAGMTTFVQQLKM